MQCSCCCCDYHCRFFFFSFFFSSSSLMNVTSVALLFFPTIVRMVIDRWRCCIIPLDVAAHLSISLAFCPLAMEKSAPWTPLSLPCIAASRACGTNLNIFRIDNKTKFVYLSGSCERFWIIARCYFLMQIWCKRIISWIRLRWCVAEMKLRGCQAVWLPLRKEIAIIEIANWQMASLHQSFRLSGST